MYARWCRQMQIENSNPRLDPMDIDVLKRAYEREKARRKQAEDRLEQKSRELYLSYEHLKESHEELQRTLDNQEKQKEELKRLIDTYTSVKDDLQLAATLQSDLLPAPIEKTTHAAHGYFQPAQFVAGDVFDYFMLTDSVFAFYIIDVEGHGTASAMTSFAIHSQLTPKSDGICKRNLVNFPNHTDAVCATVNDLNSAFYNPESKNKYFTMIYGLLDLTTGKVTWCQAGHPALMLYADNTATELGNGGFPVGILSDPGFEASEQTIKPGDRIGIYSDGITECHNEEHGFFGSDRLNDLLLQNCNSDPENSTSAVKDALLTWNGGDKFTDDVTLLLIDYISPPL